MRRCANAVCRRWWPSVAGITLALLLAADLEAQDGGSIRGTVTDASDGRALGSTDVRIVGTRLWTATNAEGRYRLDDVPVGPVTIEFSWLGYRTVSREVQVTAGVQVVDVQLDPSPVLLGEISVTGVSRQPERVVDAPAAVSVVSPQRVDELAVTGQLPLLLANEPGVQLVQSGVNDFSLNARGFNAPLNRRVLVLVDGRDVGVPILGNQEWMTLAPLEPEGSVEFIRGPGSALYGANAFNGVLNLRTPSVRAARGTRLSIGGGELSTVRVDARHARISDDLRWGLRVSAGVFQSDSWDRSRTDLGDLQSEYADGLEGTDIQVVHPLPGYEFRPLEGQTTETPFGVPGPASGDPDPQRTFYGSLRLDHYRSDGSVLTLEGGTSYAENHVSTTSLGRSQVLSSHRPWVRVGWTGEAFDVMAYFTGRESGDQYSLATGTLALGSSSTLHLEGQRSWSVFDGSTRATVGASARRTRIDSKGTLFEPAADGRVDEDYALFGLVEHDLVDRVEIQLAGRLDDGTLLDPRLSPKASVVFSPGDQHSVRASWSRSFLTPSALERFLSFAAAPPLDLSLLEAGLRASPLGPALLSVPSGTLFTESSAVPVLARGNRDLDPLQNSSWEVGYKGQLSDRLFVSLDLYASEIEDFISPLLPGVNPAFAPWRVPDGVPDAAADAVEQAVLEAVGPGLTRVEGGQTAVVVSATNAGRARERGAEVGVEVRVTDQLTASGAYTYFDFEIDDPTFLPGGGVTSANTPKHRGVVSLTFDDPGGLRAAGAFRYVDEYRWEAGLWSGPIPSSGTLDVDASYPLGETVRIGVVATNLLDQRRYQMLGGSIVGRRMLARLTWEF